MPLILKTAVSKVTNPTVTININDFRPSIAYLITDSLTFDYENILKNEFTTPYYLFPIIVHILHLQILMT